MQKNKNNKKIIFLVILSIFTIGSIVGAGFAINHVVNKTDKKYINTLIIKKWK